MGPLVALTLMLSLAALWVFFRFPHETVSVQQQIRVVRAARRGIAVEFGPQSNDDRKQFNRIIDNYNAENFVASQVAA